MFKEIIVIKKNIWYIFHDKTLNSKPIYKVYTSNNIEEYQLGITLLKFKLVAINEQDLIDPVNTLNLLSLKKFIRQINRG